MRHDPSFSLANVDAARLSISELRASEARRPGGLLGSLFGGSLGQWLSRISGRLLSEHVCAPPNGLSKVSSERHGHGTETYRCPECEQIFAPVATRALAADCFSARDRAAG